MVGKAWKQESQVAVRIASRVRKQRGLWDSAHLLFSVDPGQEMVPPNVRVVFPPQLVLSGNSLRDTARVATLPCHSAIEEVPYQGASTELRHLCMLLWRNNWCDDLNNTDTFRQEAFALACGFRGAHPSWLGPVHLRTSWRRACVWRSFFT